MTIVSKIIYGTPDALFGTYLLLFAASIPMSDTVALFMLARAAMTLINFRMPADSMPFKMLYGAGDVACGLFFLANSLSIGPQSGTVGLFLVVRGVLTYAGIYIG